MGGRISDIFFTSGRKSFVSCLVGALSPYPDRTYYLSEIVPLLQLIIPDISSYVSLLCLYNIGKHWIDRWIDG